MRDVPHAAAGAACTVAPNPRFPVNKGGLCVKGWSAASHARPPRSPARSRWCDTTGGALAPVSWEVALGRDRRTVSRGPGEIRRRRRRRLRRRLADQREGLSARQVRARRARHREHRLQRPLLHVVGRGRGQRARSASIAGCRSRSRTSRSASRRSCSSAQPGRDDAADHAVLRGAAAQRRPADRRRPAPDRDRAWAGRHLRLTPGTDAALANGLLHVLDPRRPDRRGVHRATAPRASRTRGASRRPTGPSASSASPASPRRRSSRSRTRSAARRSAMILTARGPEQQAQGVDQRARLHQRRARARRGRQAARAASARSPARATARADASTGRRPTSCPATGSIDDPDASPPHGGGLERAGVRDSARRASRRSRLLDALGTRHPRAVRDGLQPGRVRARRAARRASGSTALDTLVVADFFLSETAERADVVLPTAQWAEEDGTMTNLEGPRHPPAPRDRRRPTACAPTSRSSSALADRAGTRRAGFPTRRSATSSTSSAARPRAAWPTTRASPTSGSSSRTACSGRVRRSRPPGHAATLRRPVPDAVRPGALPRDAARRDRRRARRASFRCFLTTGRVLAHYQSGTQTRRIAGAAGAGARAASPKCTRVAAARAGVADGDRGRADHAARHGDLQGQADAHDPRGHRLRAVSLGRRAVGQPPDQRGARSDQPHARVQGLRRARRARAARRSAT